ncbi:MAG: acyltransferase family protein [Planctomycetes bacterium]|nr:acyltransferase family protein [Planctomycetota bacterium]
MPQPVERYHALDSLRSSMMFLGIMLHGLISFMETPVPFWAAHDDERSPAADFFVFVVHDFRMQTFFFLAGFFGSLLHQRYRLVGMLKHRFLRIVVPFGLGLVVIQPILQGLWFFGDLNALRLLKVETDLTKPPVDLLADHFLTGRFVYFIAPFHMWFLYYLILFFLMMVPLLGVGRMLISSRFAASGDRLFQRSLRMPGKTLLLAAITTPLVWPMKIWGMIDTPENWLPSPHLLGYYFLFFVLGWILWRHRELLLDFTRYWGLSLLIGNLFVLPTMLYLIFGAIDGLQGRGELPGPAYKLATCYVASLYTWQMVGGLIGAFHRYFNAERAWIRYLSDASYWCYLWHLVPIVALQILLAHSPLPGMVKYAIIIGVTLAILLVSYEWCVRYTWIGAILNGRKCRK